MNPQLTPLATSYLAALRSYLKTDASKNLQPALKLGRQALALGASTLEMARIHEKAWIILKLPKNGKVQRANSFFSEAITPLVETFRSAREKQAQYDQLGETLTQRTSELHSAQRQLHANVAQRKHLEADLKKCDEHYGKLLKKSLYLQDGLRQLTHKLLGDQETERRDYNTKLDNELGQSLLGVHLRLLNLKKESKVKTLGLSKQIANTQKMVGKSARSVRRVATKLTKT